ncbi:MAG: HD domain-containing protein [Methanomicrobiales archaeon]|nr:HD domain-containing protein [Methanomicrobiales archaeon]
MKIIKDPVHGYVEVDDTALHLLDSPPVQRLRYVRQLGFSYLVYPGANHTRFEHSLGTMHLAGMMCRQLGLGADERRLVLSAAILHDIGHGPFSHAIEPLIVEFTGEDHQQIDTLLCSGILAETLSGEGTDPAEVGSMIRGKHCLSGIIQGDLDVDRMDYLMRDAHYTGVPYGTVDAHRLIQSSIFTEHGIVLEESGINAAESLLIARTLMRPAVYFHHVSRIAASMLKYALLAHRAAGDDSRIQDLARMDDATFLFTLHGSPSSVARDCIGRILRRELYKRAVYVGKEQVSPELRGKTGIQEGRAMAEEIAAYAGVSPHEVLVDIPRFPTPMTMGVQVRNMHTYAGLEEVSPLVTTLNETRAQQWRLGVYAPQELRARVEAAATEVLHIKKPTKQDKLLVN